MASARPTRRACPTTSSPTRSPTLPRTSSRPWRASASGRSAPEPAPAGPLDDDAFDRLIAPLGPFERAPHLAVAVSGGPDSMALCRLADRWARGRGGRVTALIVDHGLRPGSAEEAALVAGRLRARGIASARLAWTGPKPASGLQAAARAARHRLLAAWCREAGVLHLLLAHHLDDQGETMALRAARGSGPDGLAGMAPVREIEDLRLLRPLLAVPKARLVATLRALGEAWVEDPSNLAPRFARNRLRQSAALDVAGLAARAAAHGWQRAALDRRVATWLAGAGRVDPAGFVTMSRPALAAADAALAWRAVQQALAAVGGRAYPPRRVRLARLMRALCEEDPFCGRTLAGCRVLARGDAVLILREPAAAAPPLLLEDGVRQRWDGRFVVRCRGAGGEAVVRALGDDGTRQCRALAADGAPRSLPWPVRPGLPSIWRGACLLAVPHLGIVAPSFASRLTVEIVLQPQHALAAAAFAASSRIGTGVPLLRPIDSLC